MNFIKLNFVSLSLESPVFPLPNQLRSIETKLDEIKTMEQNVWYPEVEGLAGAKPFPQVGQTPSGSVASVTRNGHSQNDFKVSNNVAKR